MHFKSIRFKTTLLYSGILLAILLLYNVILFFSLRSILIRDLDEDLRIKASEITNIFQAYEKIKSVSSYPMNVLEDLLQEHGVLPNKTLVIDDLWRSEFEDLKLKEDYIIILNNIGQTLLHSNNANIKIRDLISDSFGFSGNKTYFGTVENGSLNIRAINLPFTYKQTIPLTIQVATPQKPVYQFLNKFMFTSSVCIILIICLTSFLGGFFVKKILAPVVAVTKTANNISHADLGTKISIRDADIEMRQLIDSFNAMIDRLKKSFMHISEFNSHVAHELKTPLAIVKGELELALEQAQKTSDTYKMLSECLEEVDRMIKITKDLLLLAKLDYQPQIFKFEEINFSKLIEDIIEHTNMLASVKNIKIQKELTGGNLMVNGDKVHLRRLFLNIITNAIKYTPQGGKISLSIKPETDKVHVEISDTGEGISEENLSKIFDKFFRIDRGEKDTEAGFGLGLSIALSIAKAHQGNILVKSKINEGTTFIVILPLLT